MADDLTQSLADESPTVLLDVETGERVLHVAELDPRADSDERRVLLVRPLVRLRDGARYVVAFRALVDGQGAAIPPPEAFRRLRDGEDPGHAALEPLAARYEADVFEPLARAGIERSELALAWDFTVRTRDNAIGDMLAVREQLMEALASAPPQATVVSVEDQPETHQYRRIEATISVPLFLESAEPMAKLHRDASGRVAQNGTAEVPFTVIVPDSVAMRPQGSPPARVLQFGHGFFGTRAEIHSFIDELADERGLLVVAADWWGMSEPDRDPVVNAIVTNINDTLRFTDRVHQAMANFMALAYAVPGLESLPELAIGQAPLFDPAELYFYGISQGHILGGTYLALSPVIERGVLSVGGADLSLMLFRARPFLAFLALIATVVDDPLDQQTLGAIMQLTFDRIDPLSHAPLMSAEPLGAAKQVLMQIGIGDAAVPNIASHLHARALGLTHLDPAPRAIVGLPTDPGPLPSGIVEFDFGIDPLPGIEALPAPEDNEVHEGVRRLPAAKDQLDRFLRPGGMVEHTCDGACDPE
jgi:hypothetical protein